MDRRYGTFQLQGDKAKNRDSDVMKVMANCAILNAVYLAYSDMIEYQATSEMFDVLPEGEIIPEYDWVFTDYSIQAVKR